MDYKKNQELLFNLIKDKSVLKQDVFSNIILNFKVLKGVLKEIGDDLNDKLSSNISKNKYIRKSCKNRLN